MTLLNAKKLAEKLSLSVRTVWRLRSSGKLPKPVTIGSSVRWKQRDVDRWLDLDCPDMDSFEVLKGQ